MVWTAPRTWASGEVVTAAALNTDLRDDLNELTLHKHAGGSGSGSATLGNLVTVDFIDAAVPAAPGGTLTRVFSSATLFGWINAGGTFLVATSSHEHSIASATIVATGHLVATTGGGTTITNWGTISGSGTTTLIASVFTASGTGSRTVLVAGFVAMHNAPAIGASGTFELRRDATVLETRTNIVTATANYVHIFSTIEYNRPSGSVTYALVYRATAGDTLHILGRAIYVNEFRQA